MIDKKLANFDSVDNISVTLPLMMQVLQYVNSTELETPDLLRIGINLVNLSKKGTVSTEDYNSVIGSEPVIVIIPYHDVGMKLSSSDSRDYKYTIKYSRDTFKDYVDLREFASPVENQANIGSCVGNSVTNAYELIVNQRKPEKFVELSRLFVYYNSRLLEGAPEEDDGTSLRAALKGTEIYGICTEALWPYDVTKFATKPSKEAYDNGLTRRIRNYRKLYTIESIVDTLNDSHPAIIGISIYNSFYQVSDVNPVVPEPTAADGYQGEHAVCVVGYDIPKRLLLIKNSFGTEWGDAGYAWLPFQYCKQYMFEAWVFDINV